jgi:hypothetical protein
MGAREQRDEVGVWRSDAKAMVGEGRRVGEGQRRAGGAMNAPARSHACGSGERKCRCIFLFFLD